MTAIYDGYDGYMAFSSPYNIKFNLIFYILKGRKKGVYPSYPSLWTNRADEVTA